MKQACSRKRVFCYHTVLNNGVTGSCHVLDFKFSNDENRIFLCDVGMFLGGETEKTREARRNEDLMNNLSFPIEIDTIDGIMVSHNHTDHMGRLPMLVHLGYNKPIYATYETAELLRNSLRDCFNCIRRSGQKLYDERDVAKTLDLLEIVDDRKTINLFNDGENEINVTFFGNGHLAGSASILFQAKEREAEDENVFYTGDYKKDNIFFDVPDLPEWVYELPIHLIVESTYGTTDSKDIKYTFQNNVARAVKRGGSVIIPVIALERTEIVLYNLKLMQQSKILDTNVPIFLVGKLATQYLRMYCQRGKIKLKKEVKDFIPKNFSTVGGEEVNSLLNSKKQMIVLATPGMMTQGNSYNFIMKHIENDKDLIQITSYVASELGNKILNAKRGEETSFTTGQRVKVNAEIQQTNEFSAHAKRDELYEFIKKFQNILSLTIVHGDPDTRKAFAEYVRNQPDFPEDIPIIIGTRNKRIRYSDDKETKVIHQQLGNIVAISLSTKKREKRKKKIKQHYKKNR